MFSINMKVAKLGAFEIELKGQEDNGTYGKHLGGFCSCLTRGISAFAETQCKMHGGLYASICLPRAFSWLVPPLLPRPCVLGGPAKAYMSGILQMLCSWLPHPEMLQDGFCNGL